MTRKKKSGKTKSKPKAPSAPKLSANPLHPGQVIQDHYLTPQKETQAWLTEKLGWKLTRLNKLINGKGGVTAGSALDLARALRTKPEFWMQLQLDYDLARAKASAKSRRAHAKA